MPNKMGVAAGCRKETSNLGVGGSNPSERANKTGDFLCGGCEAKSVWGRAGDAN